MIRINLISEAIPQAGGETFRLGPKAQALVLAVCLAGAVGWLFFDYYRTETAVARVERTLAAQRVALGRLDRLRGQVATFERQKTALDRRIKLITQLETSRGESRQLLESIASTVNQTPLLWLTSLSRKGDSLTIQGTAGSINAVADFISALELSDHFSQIEMRTTQQEPSSSVTSFDFSLSAVYQTTQAAPAGTAAQAGEPAE